MREATTIIDCLSKTPDILEFLLSQIPSDLYRVRRLEGKWCIHEQVCHLAEAQSILIERFEQFEAEINPMIRNYIPPVDQPASHYLDMDMDVALKDFCQTREQTISMLRNVSAGYWQRQGRHEGFTPYNAMLLLTHSLNVDYAHLFSIEQLGLTRMEYENGIVTIP